MTSIDIEFFYIDTDCNRISERRKCLLVTSAHRATKQLKLRSYRFQAVHQLQQRDAATRDTFCHWFHRFVREWAQV
jgi:hypothetical protein